MPAASRGPPPAWVKPGAKGTWLSKTKGKPLPVTVSKVDPATGAATVTFDSDPSAYKVVPASQLGANGPLQPLRSQPHISTPVAGAGVVSAGDILAAAAAAASRRKSPLEAAAAAVARGSAPLEASPPSDHAEERDEERKRRKLEQEVAAAEAERERVRKLDELRKWRAEEVEREREKEREKQREAEEERQRAAEQTRKLEERRLRREAREREAKEQQREEENWAKFKEQAKQAAEEQQLPAWAVLGARCTWTSDTLKKQLAVTVTGVDHMQGVVTVTFESDPSAFKVLQAAQLIEGGPLQPKKKANVGSLP